MVHDTLPDGLYLWLDLVVNRLFVRADTTGRAFQIKFLPRCGAINIALFIRTIVFDAFYVGTFSCTSYAMNIGENDHFQDRNHEQSKE